MKKLMTALAIVAIASVAQAELLATWTSDSAVNLNGANIAQTGGSTYGFHMVSSSGFVGTTAPAAMTYSAAGADAASAAAAFTANQYLYFTWNTDYTLSLDSVIGRYTRGSTGGQSAQWGTVIDNTWTSIGSAISITLTVTPGVGYTGDETTFSSVTGLESGQLALAFYGGSASTASAWARLDSRPTSAGFPAGQAALQLNGTMTPTAIPEPATMSLLGLGALAMVLRRKMKK